MYKINLLSIIRVYWQEFRIVVSNSIYYLKMTGLNTLLTKGSETALPDILLSVR